MIQFSGKLYHPSWGQLGHLGPILGSFWAILGPSWGFLGPLGAILRPLPFPTCLVWAILGLLGAILGPSWGHLGASWAHLGAILGPPCLQHVVPCLPCVHMRWRLALSTVLYRCRLAPPLYYERRPLSSLPPVDSSEQQSLPLFPTAPWRSP